MHSNPEKPSQPNAPELSEIDVLTRVSEIEQLVEALPGNHYFPIDPANLMEDRDYYLFLRDDLAADFRSEFLATICSKTEVLLQFLELQRQVDRIADAADELWQCEQQLQVMRSEIKNKISAAQDAMIVLQKQYQQNESSENLYALFEAAQLYQDMVNGFEEGEQRYQKWIGITDDIMLRIEITERALSDLWDLMQL